jgi:hypothetical protein
MSLPLSIPEAITAISDVQREADMDLVGHEESIGFVGLQMRRNAARSELPRLKRELSSIVGPNAGAIFVTGTAEAARAFADIAEDDVPAIVLDAREMYDVLAKAMSAGVRADALFSQETLVSFISGLRALMSDLGVQSIAAPDFTPFMGRRVPALADLAIVAKEALASAKADGALNAMYLAHRASEEALKAEWQHPFLPVVVLNATPDEVEGALVTDLFDGRNVVVEAKESPEENDIVIAVNKLKAKNKNRTRKNTKEN